MFGMSSKEFWEDEPQLYWAYRLSFEKKTEFRQKEELEKLKLGCWLQGKTNEIAVSTALNNAFAKKKIKFPTYAEFSKNFGSAGVKPTKKELAKKLEGKTDADEIGDITFNYWARI